MNAIHPEKKEKKISSVSVQGLDNICWILPVRKGTELFT